MTTLRRAASLATIALLVAGSARAQQRPPECGSPSPHALPSDSIGSAVRMLLTDPSATVRLAAARALGRADSRDLIKQAAARPPGDKDPRHALAIALSDTNDAVRIAAACALGVVGDASTLPSLRMRAAKASPALRLVAEWATARVRAAAQPLLLRDATVIDGTAVPARPHTSVLIEADLITRVGPAESFSVPAGTRIVDASGLWVTPGLWDMHVHLGKTGATALPLLIGAGVTAVRDMGGELDALLDLRRRILNGDLVGPRLVLAGPMLESPATLERLDTLRTNEPYRRTRIAVRTVADARRVVDSIARLGVDFIKVRETANLDIYREIVVAARANNLRLAGHAPYSMDPLEGAHLGITTFEHASYPYPLDTVPVNRERLLDAFRAGQTAIVPTMVAWSSYLMDPDSVKALIADSAGVRDARRRLLSEQLVQEWGFDIAPKQRLSDAALRGWCGFVNRTLADLTAMHKAGIPILPGTDLSTVALFPGWSLHDELQTLVDGGVFSPGDALRSATSLAARYAGQAEQVGTVEAGKRADLLLLGADPTVSIAALRELEMVIVNGKVLDRATLLKLRGGVPLKYEAGVDLLPRLDGAGCSI